MKIEWKTCLRVGFTVLCVALLVKYFTSLGDFAAGIFTASAPLIIGCVVAYLVNIVMTSYEKLYFPKSTRKLVQKSRRPVCMILALITLVLIIFVIVMIVIPELWSCIMLLIEKIPAAINDIVAHIDADSAISKEIVTTLKSVDWKSRIEQLVNIVTSGVGGVIEIVIGTLTHVFSGLVTALIAVIFSVYLLLDKERIARQFSRILSRYLKPKITSGISYVLGILNDCFRRYIIGQCTEAVILGLLCTLGMMILKLPYASMIGALIAFTALIPIAGAYIGAFVGAFMILTVDPVKALVFLVFIVILQQLEGNLIYPRVVGSSIGLPGIWVLAAVTVGGGLMGVIGMLLGVPLVATVYRLLKDDVARGPKPAVVTGEETLSANDLGGKNE